MIDDTDSDTITEVATALIAASTRAEGDSVLDVLRRQAKARREVIASGPRDTASRKIREMVEAAREYANLRFPATLGLLLDGDEDWTGYPPTWHPCSHFTARPACAVAFLGSGAWLRFESWVALPTFETATELTLLHPCSCGRGYRELDVTDEDELLNAIDDMAAAPTGWGACEGHLCGAVPYGTVDNRPYFLVTRGEMPGDFTDPADPSL